VSMPCDRSGSPRRRSDTYSATSTQYRRHRATIFESSIDQLRWGYQPPAGKTVCACKHLFVVSLACFVAVRSHPTAFLVIYLVWRAARTASRLYYQPHLPISPAHARDGTRTRALTAKTNKSTVSSVATSCRRGPPPPSLWQVCPRESIEGKGRYWVLCDTVH